MRQTHSSPTRNVNTSISQGKLSPNKPKIPTTAEGMLKGLGIRYKNIYEKVKELMDKKVELRTVNEETVRAFDEEMRSQEQVLNKLQEEIDEFIVKNNDLVEISRQHKEDKAPQLTDELTKLSVHVTDLQDQMQTILDSIKNETIRTDALEKQIVFFRKEGIDVDAFLKSPTKEDRRDRRDENLSAFPKYKNLLKKSVQSAPPNELDMLLNISPKSERRIKNVAGLQEQLKDVILEGDVLRHENEKLRKKIMANMHSDYEKPAFDEQNTDREVVEHAKKQHKLKVSKLFADEDKLLSHISQHTQNGVLTRGEDEYIKRKDAQNEENFRRILEIKELERLQGQILQQEAYITELKRNIFEREHLLFDQRKEIGSLEDNLNNLNFDIRQNVLEKDILENRYKAKTTDVEDMREQYEETVRSLPEHIRPRSGNDSPRFSAGNKQKSPSPRKSKKNRDAELDDLLNVAPKTLNFRKN